MRQESNNRIESRLSKNRLYTRQSAMDKRSLLAEKFRTINTNIKFMKNNGNSIRVIGITSSIKSEGKTFVSNNLAMTYAAQGKKTLLIDMDLHQPALSKFYGFSTRSKGLSDVLSGECEPLSVIRESSIENLYILSSGFIPPIPIELLSLSSMSQLIKEMKTEFDFIIFDAPPVNILDDIRTVGNLLDGVVYVTSYNKTKEAELLAGIDALKKANTNILGVIVNRKKYTKTEKNLYKYY